MIPRGRKSAAGPLARRHSVVAAAIVGGLTVMSCPAYAAVQMAKSGNDSGVGCHQPCVPKKKPQRGLRPANKAESAGSDHATPTSATRPARRDVSTLKGALPIGANGAVPATGDDRSRVLSPDPGYTIYQATCRAVPVSGSLEDRIWSAICQPAVELTPRDLSTVGVGAPSRDLAGPRRPSVTAGSPAAGISGRRADHRGVGIRRPDSRTGIGSGRPPAVIVSKTPRTLGRGPNRPVHVAKRPRAAGALGRVPDAHAPTRAGGPVREPEAPPVRVTAHSPRGEQAVGVPTGKSRQVKNPLVRIHYSGFKSPKRKHRKHRHHSHHKA